MSIFKERLSLVDTSLTSCDGKSVINAMNKDVLTGLTNVTNGWIGIRKQCDKKEIKFSSGTV